MNNIWDQFILFAIGVFAVIAGAFGLIGDKQFFLNRLRIALAIIAVGTGLFGVKAFFKDNDLLLAFGFLCILVFLNMLLVRIWRS